MPTELEAIVRETMALTGSDAPSLLQPDAPVLSQSAPGSFYLIGLIGGKEVGKSAFVNALVGTTISDETSFGRGTETAIAYAHRGVESSLRQLLETIAPGHYAIVTHDNDSLGAQVLVDLPDIDSRWQSHLQLTRSLLRHMLYPIWMTSVEKYADRQPQQMLKAVAEGNSPENFLFCLNKADQLRPEEAEELRKDYANRIGRLVSIDPPKVWLISAHRPDAFDLPALREKLSKQRSTEIVQRSHNAAQMQQRRTLLDWVDRQQVDQRVERLDRLYESAREDVAERIGSPLLEQTIPGMLRDPGHRLALVNEVLDQRIARWPIVNVLHTLLSPVMLLIQQNIGQAQSTGARALAAAHLQINSRPLGSTIQGTFAQLQQTHPTLGELYARRKLWEPSYAEGATEELTGDLADAVTLQREAVREQFSSRFAGAFAPLRYLLTIGALLWFPFVQPVLEAFLQQNLAYTGRDIALLVVHMLGVTYLLKQLGFFAIYFLLLWLLLRWHTHRQVTRLIRRWQAHDDLTSQANLVTRVVQWMDDLVSPIGQARDRARTLVNRIEQARKSA